MLQNKIEQFIEKLDKATKNKSIKVISHFDTDGITSATIMARALERWNKRFSLCITKGLDQEFINKLSEENVLLFLDLASGSLNYLKDKKTEVFILDHHEVIQEIPSNILIVNPSVEKQEPISSAGLCYLFAKSLAKTNIDLATLAVIGMVGDMLEKNLGKTYDSILKDSETFVKKGLLIYPSTRPLDKALEYSSNPFIPGVSGSYKGVIELLKEANIDKKDGKFKSLSELTEEEMSALITAVMLKRMHLAEHDNLVGNLYLVKFFNKLEDARELSALINACSRMDYPSIALGFCLGNKESKASAEKIYIEYKQHLISALKFVNETQKISGKKYTIINAQDNIKDTIIGTVTSIISNSPLYERGTIIIGLAYNQDKIKVSARIAGRSGENVREILNRVVVPLGGEVGGHPQAAGCLISKDQEALFIEELKKVLEVEKVNL
ncbi:MAG: DHH family phosphoesterase [Nanoarchaeota archaeon]